MYGVCSKYYENDCTVWKHFDNYFVWKVQGTLVVYVGPMSLV